MNRTLQIMVVVAGGIAAFVFFVLVYFPLDAVVGHFMAGLEARTRGEYRVSYDRMDPSLVFDSVFSGFKLERKSGDGYEEVFSAPKIRIGVSLAALVSRSVDARFAAELQQGKIAGRVVLSDDRTLLDLKIAGVRLQQFGWLKSALKREEVEAKLRGVLDGEVDLELARTVSETEGDISLRVTGMIFKDGVVNIQGAKISLPDIALSPADNFARFEGSLDEGRLTVRDISIPGPDVEVQVNGRLNFTEGFVLSRMNLRGRFALAEMLFEKLPLLGLIKEHKTADGFFPLTVAGTPKDPQIRVGSLNLGEMLKF